MIELGKYATLEVVKTLDFGVYLDAGTFGEVLLPKRYVPEGTEPGHDVMVFLYCDSEDRVIATTDRPHATVDEFAFLRVKDVSEHGAFLDWGLMKDLFVPFREQSEQMEVGKSYMIKVLLDAESDRIIGTSKIAKHLLEVNDGRLSVGEEVKLTVLARTDIGTKVIVNDFYFAMVFRNEIFQVLPIGEILRGYVKNIREDGKMDISLQKQGYDNQIPDASNVLLRKLKDNNGFLPITDNSAPEDIYETLKMSKKTFKKAVGGLYKKRLISLEKNGIKLV